MLLAANSATAARKGGAIEYLFHVLSVEQGPIVSHLFHGSRSLSGCLSAVAPCFDLPRGSLGRKVVGMLKLQIEVRASSPPGASQLTARSTAVLGGLIPECKMSNIYHTEPATHGKVLLHTSFGDIDIELWGKECPKACRNFVQLAMEGVSERARELNCRTVLTLRQPQPQPSEQSDVLELGLVVGVVVGSCCIGSEIKRAKKLS